MQFNLPEQEENFNRKIISSKVIREEEGLLGDQPVLYPIYEYVLSCGHVIEKRFEGGMKPARLECPACKNPQSTQKIAFLTGFSGQDAKTLTHLLLSKNYIVVGGLRYTSSLNVDNLISLFDDNLRDNPESILDTTSIDLNDEYSISHAIKETLDKYGKIDELYHLGGISSVPESFNNPGLCINVNGQSCYYLLEKLRKYSPETKFFYASSSETLQIDEKQEYYDEETPKLALNPYAASKILGETWVKFFREAYGMFVVNGILFPHSNGYRHSSFFTMKLCKAVVQIKNGIKKDKLILGPLDFWRDECWADYIIEGIWKMLQLDEPTDMVLGNGKLHSGYDYIKILFDKYNLDPEKWIMINETLIRPKHSAKVGANTKLAQKLIGWQNEKIKLDEHLSRLCEYQNKLLK